MWTIRSMLCKLPINNNHLIEDDERWMNKTKKIRSWFWDAVVSKDCLSTEKCTIIILKCIRQCRWSDAVLDAICHASTSAKKKNSFIVITYATSSVFVNYKIAAMHARADDCNSATWCDDYELSISRFSDPHIEHTHHGLLMPTRPAHLVFVQRISNDQKKMFLGSRTECEAGAVHWACDRSRCDVLIADIHNVSEHRFHDVFDGHSENLLRV